MHHDIVVSLDPATGRIGVIDTVTLPARPARGVVEFVLNEALRLSSSKPPAREVPLGEAVTFSGINSASVDPARQAGLRSYRVGLPPGAAQIELAYEGKMNFGLSDEKEQYTRGFRETRGIVSPEGVYLAGDSFWYPTFNRDLVSFTIEVQQPEGWHVVSEGNGSSRYPRGHAAWDSAGPTDEIHLVGGPLHVFRDTAGGIETAVYLHDAKDEALARKYLEATKQYLEMYTRLIGPYPYGKFALVENFWETGFGMPTFTLLGPQVIRFPFIITSSYPHEILHNWWGNSVFVDYESGNWCEGLTAYLADHLIQEQRGAGADYRRSTLQKYRDYVRDGRDFPLSEFRSRESASTEAVGYGKALMMYHMLRLGAGDEMFRRTLQAFYRDFKGKRASFADFEQAVERVTGRDFTRFFADWVDRAGAPELEVKVTAVRTRGEESGTGGAGAAGYEVEGILTQAQPGDPFAIDVPLVLQAAGGGIVRETVRLEGREARFTVRSPAAPLALHVDPWFDVFRKLDPRETAASIGQIFGEPRVLALLPSKAPPAEIERWRALFASWTSANHSIETMLDTGVASLPHDRAVWIAGRSNAWAERVFDGSGAVVFKGGAVEIDGERVATADHTLVAVIRHPANVEKAVGWLAVDPHEAFPGLGQKLPHYGKYSYLAFEGTEPVNVLKGQWKESDSPMRVNLRNLLPQDAAVHAPAAPPLPAEAREPLIDLPPVFSEKALLEHVAWLADPAREGRFPGSDGHAAAGEYIAARFKEIGLLPGGSDGSYLQPFEMELGPGARAREAAKQANQAPAASSTSTRGRVANVIGYIEGSKAEWAGQSVVVSAHYDHLGRGWPDVHKGDEGKLHPGADDNASGVAVMIELARALAAGPPPSRTIVFAAFTGEEAGRIGSKYYVENEERFPASKATGAINLDTVGRLGEGQLSVLATGTASEWQHIFRGASFGTGVESRSVPEAMPSSDHFSFIEKGVPAVQVFTGAHADYHRPTDTVEKVDAAGLVRVAAFVQEAVSYLAERPEPLTNTIAGRATAPAEGRPGEQPASRSPSGEAQRRRASLGTVPDFAFEGQGVRVSGVVSGSAAEKAGIREGDVLVAIDGNEIKDLRSYSELLSRLSPGQTVDVAILRAGERVALKVTLGER